MNTSSGQILPLEEVLQLPTEDKAKYVEIKRDLTKLEESTRQIKLYSPCGCGSGKKFKFCCYKQN